MVFLLYECRLSAGPLVLNAERADAAWVAPSDFHRHDLNVATVDTFRKLGLLAGGPGV